MDDLAKITQIKCVMGLGGSGEKVPSDCIVELNRPIHNPVTASLYVQVEGCHQGRIQDGGKNEEEAVVGHFGEGEEVEVA